MSSDSPAGFYWTFKSVAGWLSKYCCMHAFISYAANAKAACSIIKLAVFVCATPFTFELLGLSSSSSSARREGPPPHRRLRPVAESDLRQPTAVQHSSSPSVNPSLLLSRMLIVQRWPEENALQCTVFIIVVGLHNHPKLAKLTSRNLNKSLGIHKVSFCILSVIELHWLWCRIRNFKQFLLAATVQIWPSPITYGRRW